MGKALVWWGIGGFILLIATLIILRITNVISKTVFFVLLVIFIIMAVLITIGAIYIYNKNRKDPEGKGKPIKQMSTDEAMDYIIRYMEYNTKYLVKLAREPMKTILKNVGDGEKKSAIFACKFREQGKNDEWWIIIRLDNPNIILPMKNTDDEEVRQYLDDTAENPPITDEVRIIKRPDEEGNVFTEEVRKIHQQNKVLEEIKKISEQKKETVN